MSRLTPEGQRVLGDICRRYGIGDDVGLSLLDALACSGGTMAQFNHPELGGSGQWMAGGMVMVGDMFNQGLKARVDGLCSELAALLAASPFRPAPSPPGVSVFVASGGGTGGQWWPAALGAPNWQGSQNNLRYAFFACANRLVLDLSGDIAVYDTSGYVLTGVSQQQSSGTGASLTLTGPGGIVTLDRLCRIDSGRGATTVAVPTPGPAAEAPLATAGVTEAPSATAGVTEALIEHGADPGDRFGDHLAGTKWLYAVPNTPASTAVTLGADGVLLGAGGDALRYWAVEDGVLWFYGVDGRASARFDRILGDCDGERILGVSPPGTGTAVVLRADRPQPAAAVPAAAVCRTTLEQRLDLCGSEWQLCESGGGSIARLRLLADGSLSGSQRPAESAWRFDDGMLVFLHKSGRPTTRFTRIVIDDGCWTLSGRYLANDRIVHELRQV